jgi:predicted nucleotidyltransferase
MADQDKNEKQLFDEFADALKLDPDERRRAQDLHNEITALLKKYGLIITAFLQGSFARKTMIAPLRDVDKIVIVAMALLGLSPDEIMDRLEAVLADAYPSATFERTRHSLKMDFGSESFTFDTVPAREMDGDTDDVEIVNRGTGGWTRSNTRELIRVVAERNQATGGRFVEQVRMGKQAVCHALDGDLPGLHVEAIAYDAITTTLDHAEAVCRVLERGAQMLAGSYSDPTGRDLISQRLDPAVKERARQWFVEAARRAKEARDLAARGDLTAAQDIWRNLFGDPFPRPAAQDADDAIRNLYGGTITSTGRVSPTPAGRHTGGISTRSWRLR